MILRTRDDYKEYLKQIFQMEFAVFELVNLKERIETEVFKHKQFVNIQIDCVNRPVLDIQEFTMEEPSKPDEIFVIDYYWKDFNLLGKFWIPFIMIFIVLCLFLKSVSIGTNFIISALIAAGIDAILYKRAKEKHRLLLEEQNGKAQKKYEEDLMDYQYEKNRYAEESAEAEEKYKTQQEEYRKQIDSIIREAQLKEEIIENQLLRIEKQLGIARHNLERLYSQGILYPKYRYLIPICSIYEYFDSGRVNTLEGTDGAYNLYETEYRSNQIVVSLKDISDDKNEIMNTQFQLYQKLKTAESHVTWETYKVHDFLAESFQKPIEVDLWWIEKYNSEAASYLSKYR